MKGCLAAIGGVVVVFTVAIVIIVAVSGGKGTTGPTSSPALVTTTEAASAPVAVHQRPQTFRGNGDENIGTISVSTPSTLHWHCADCLLFSVSALSTDDTSSISVDSQKHSSGVTAVEPGTYRSVNVLADEGEGSSGWTITVTTGQ